MVRSAIIFSVCWVVLASHLAAEVADPTLRTTHAHYPGEGAFQSVEDCVNFATAGKSADQERAIALFHWLLGHQFHLQSPQEWIVPGTKPGANPDDTEMVVYDANRGRFSYGYGLCGTVHAWNEPYWRVLGMNSRRRAFPGHTNSEIEYGGRWHAFDTDMAGLVFRTDGVVAGYEDIVRDPSLVRENDRGIVCYPFAWPSDFQTMQRGWRQVADGGHWYCMYNSGYAAMPGIVHLRRGETFTRHFDRDIFGGPGKRRFWHIQTGGPSRDWTFVNIGEPTRRDGKFHCRGNATYANAVFRYEPDLSSDAWLEGVVQRSGTLIHSRQTPHLRCRDEAASVTFAHFSPYVICGDPQDDANPMTGPATDGCVFSGEGSGQFSLDISVDNGQTWQDARVANGRFRIDATEQTKGRYGWLARFNLSPGAVLNRLVFETTCQMNVAMYPRLTPNGCQVTYRSTSRAATHMKPNFGLAENELAQCEVRQLRSSNVSYSPRSKQQRMAYTVTGNKPGTIVFAVTAPAPLVELSAAARYSLRSPQPPNCHFALDLSTDEGRSWQPISSAFNAVDNEYSSGWVYGRVPILDRQASKAWVRVHLNGGGYSTGLIDFEAFGIHRSNQPSQTNVTWAWKVPGSSEIASHRHEIAAGGASDSWIVPTPAHLTDAWVEIKVP